MFKSSNVSEKKAHRDLNSVFVFIFVYLVIVVYSWLCIAFIIKVINNIEALSKGT